jgi:hypothetical protein
MIIHLPRRTGVSDNNTHFGREECLVGVLELWRGGAVGQLCYRERPNVIGKQATQSY